MRKFILGILLMGYWGSVMGYPPPMPMPLQYQNLVQYREALAIWQSVYSQRVNCSERVYLPRMPMPTQYQSLDLYREALEVWKSVSGGSQGKTALANGKPIIEIPSLPLPQRFERPGDYQAALEAWLKAYRQVVAKMDWVTPPPMPSPEQYRNQQQFREALAVWQQLLESF